MLVTKIRIQEENPMTLGEETWPLPPCDLHLSPLAGENGYLIKNSSGLGPPTINAVVAGFSSTGVSILTSDPEKRVIALKIELTPKFNQTAESLRDDLYKFVSRSVLVALMDGAQVVAKTTGFIRSFEALHFTTTPEIQITIECVDGVFSAPTSVPIPLTALQEENPLIHYSEGTAPTGIDIQFTVTAPESGFTIANHEKGWHVGTDNVVNMFYITYPLLVNDIILLSTYGKDRKVTLVRDEEPIDLTGYVNAGAVWPRLHAGVNVWNWTLSDEWMEFDSASYIPRYWGV